MSDVHRRWLFAFSADSCSRAWIRTNLPLFCPAGALGYIGCCVVARLLAAGHTVRATWRHCEAQDSGARAVKESLDALPGAEERLRWFAADLLEEGSFDEAIAGCK